ncbi:MAG TPA: hypothetical protein VK422_01915 [Pyrinomonadaceae bacterium]|nr:hypothetical protein [Pyrinomonadaceae bacterium]
MKNFIRIVFGVGYVAIIVLFFCCAAALVVLAALELWKGVNPAAGMELRERFNSVLESIGLLTIAVVALELGQTVLEEEVQRESQVSAPTRVRRFMSRFLVVVVVALAIESLVSVFELAHDDPTKLPHATAIAAAAAVLLIAWGVFVKLNRSAEELEPEAMEKTKQEDIRLE